MSVEARSSDRINTAAIRPPVCSCGLGGGADGLGGGATGKGSIGGGEGGGGDGAIFGTISAVTLGGSDTTIEKEALSAAPKSEVLLMSTVELVSALQSELSMVTVTLS